MPKFRYRLETLLRLRIAARDERRADLAMAQRAEDVLLRKLDELEAERNELVTRSRRLAAPGPADIDGLLRSHRYELVLKANARQLADQLGQVRAEIDRRHAALVEADRQVRVLEKLRERKLAAHQNSEAKLENKQLDEMATMRFARQRVGEEVRP